MTAMSVKKTLSLGKSPLNATLKGSAMISGDYSDPMQRTTTNLNRAGNDLDFNRTFASPSSTYTRWRDVLARKEANFNQHNVAVKANLAKSFQQ
jgi:hypothetical protein